MSAFRIRSAGGFDQRGSAEIAVGQARVVLSSWGPAAADTVGVYLGPGKAPRRCWTAVTPRTIREALSYAAALDEAEGWPPTPACVEDASGACVNPLHNHTGEAISAAPTAAVGPPQEKDL